jgi:integrase
LAGKRLTSRTVETAGPGKHHDGGGVGLYLRVDPNLSRFWIQRLTIGGKRREIGLGSPPVVTLVAARDKALENARLVRDGRDPLAEKRKARGSLSFAEAVERALVAKEAAFGNDKHRKQWRSTLDAYAAPVLGALPVDGIATRDVLRVLEPIWKDKTETAKRLRGRIEAVLSWATVSGYREGDNPARWKGNLAELLPKPGSVAKAGNHPALALSDVPAWRAALARREGMAAKALLFITMTVARSGEVRGATWAEIDLGGVADADRASRADRQAVWTIPASRMKAGREHRVPLTAEAVALLESLPRLAGSPYVFPAPRGGMLSDMSISAVMRRMQEAEVKAGGSGFLDGRSGRPAVPHGLRSTFRDWAAEQGYDRDLAEIALAHTVGSEVERAYRRSDMIQRRRAMLEAWGKFLSGADQMT